MDGTQYPHTTRSGPPRSRRLAGITWVGWVGLALASLALVALGTMIVRAADDRPVAAADVRDVLAAPQLYLDQRIIVSGRVEELLTHRAMTLGSDLSAGTLPALLETSAFVNGYDLGGVVPLEYGQLYQEQDYVQFAGTLEPFERETLESRLNIVLNEEFFADLEGRPVLLVDRLDATALGAVLPTYPPAKASD